MAGASSEFWWPNRGAGLAKPVELYDGASTASATVSVSGMKNGFLRWIWLNPGRKYRAGIRLRCSGHIAAIIIVFIRILR